MTVYIGVGVGIGVEQYKLLLAVTHIKTDPDTDSDPEDAGDAAFLRKINWLKSVGEQLDIGKQLRKDCGKNTAIDFER